MVGAAAPRTGSRRGRRARRRVLRPPGDEFAAQKALMQDFLAGRVKELVLAEDEQQPRSPTRRGGAGGTSTSRNDDVSVFEVACVLAAKAARRRCGD